MEKVFSVKQCRFLGMIPESESSDGCGVEWVCMWSRLFEQVHLVILYRYQSVSNRYVSGVYQLFQVSKS